MPRLLVALAFALLALLQTPPQEPPQKPPSVFDHPVAVDSAPAAYVAVNTALRAADPLRADYSEEKTIKALKRPLRSKGRLVLSSKLGLYRASSEPRVSEVVLSASGIAQRDATGTVDRIDFTKQPIVKAFVDAFLLVLSGDERSLAGQFQVYFLGTKEQWTLGFVPRKEPLSKVIAHIVVEGRGEAVERYVVTEKSGDTTVAIWSNVVSKTPLTADEELRWFGWVK